MATAVRPTAATHAVTNQVPPLEDLDLLECHPPLVEALEREGGGWARARVGAAARAYGSAETLEHARLADEHPPKLITHDRFGHRVDEVEYHPSYHALMDLSSRLGVHSLPWTSDEPGRHVARAAMGLCTTEAGHGCPMTMTFAVIPALRAEPTLAAQWEPQLLADRYDGRLVPPAEKGSAKAGMSMTEKQGGSDVRANTTTATALDEDGTYLLRGHKWFTSAPMCDLFLTLAYADEGLTCVAVPRLLPDGERNVFRLQRLKDKLGNRSNASSEVEYDGTWAQRVGEEGRGVATIIEMVAHTRLDCVIGSATGMRLATTYAIHHAQHRSAFGKLLVDQPLMRNVLADLAVESEAATALAMRLARAYDEGDDAFKRLATAVAKFWVCKRQPGHVAEALEVLGGNGYVEDSGLPRLYREAPLNSVWEGSGNVNALDVLRALVKQPQSLDALRAELDLARGADPRYDALVAALDAELPGDAATLEQRARRVVERLALALQGSLLVRHAPPAVADAFCASRLGGDGGGVFGTLPASVDVGAIVERHAAQLA